MDEHKVIVTGGAGFIGSHLVDRLIDLGHQVVVYDNLSTGKRSDINPKAHFIKSDLSRPTKLKKADYIFHFAALPRIERSFDHPEETHAANVTATLNVLKQASRLKIKRLIFASSSSVYGKIEAKDLPVNESHPTNPQSPYAAQKLMSEIYCKLFTQQLELDTVILRLFNIYGPRQPTTGAYKLVIPIFIEQKTKGKPLTIYGDGRQTRDFTHVNDAVQALLLAMQRQKNFNGEIINIGSGIPTSILKLANLTGGEKHFIKPNPRSSWEEKYKFADISKAKKLLNWQPKINLKSGLQMLV